MEQIKDMLKRMGFEIVADEMKTTEWTENDGFLVAEAYGVYHRIDYTVNSYGKGTTIVSVKRVEPKEVTKVEYV